MNQAEKTAAQKREKERLMQLMNEKALIDQRNQAIVAQRSVQHPLHPV